MACQQPDDSHRQFQRQRPLTADCQPRLHLLLGDSIAHKAGITSCFEDDEVFDRAVGGETWQSLLHHLETEVTAWQTAAAAWDVQGMVWWDVSGGSSRTESIYHPRAMQSWQTLQLSPSG